MKENERKRLVLLIKRMELLIKEEEMKIFEYGRESPTGLISSGKIDGLGVAVIKLCELQNEFEVEND